MEKNEKVLQKERTKQTQMRKREWKETQIVKEREIQRTKTGINRDR